ncbi:MAG TPA: M67 family metallopeptidase [Gemmatimonadales bacterium]|nr:M67 family metallopeptidase [Gemmatimonadales bacterium]
MTLRLSDAMADEIRRHGELAYPAECCGVLAGRAGETKEVVRLVPMHNRRTDDPHRYLIAPDDLRRTISELRGCELEVLGYYHSHPDHPAAPSGFDTEHAWPWYSYIIVGVDRGRAAELASWVLEDDRSAMSRESLEVFSEV